MIIGSIVEIGFGAAPGASDRNGAAMLNFSIYNDAVTWAVLQSQEVSVSGNQVTCLTTVINTSDNTRRWWWNGTEYTG